MKTIQEIKNLTNEAIKEKAEKKRLAAIKAKEKAKKDREEMIERAKDVSFFFEAIEEEAKKGKNTYSTSLGQKDENSEYDKLHMKYIKKYLKDFNPTFTEEQHEGCEYNYEGGPIDGSEYYYTAIHVHFNW